MAIKKVEAASFVIPRYSWSLGSIYSQYNDNTVGHPTSSYYVITDSNQVYICIQQGRNATGTAVTSTVKPTGAATEPFETADGYIWKFLYTIGALRASQFLAANFMPVTLYGSSDSDAAADQGEQLGIQEAARVKEITGYTVVSGGTGYTTVPTISVVGDGTGAKGVATIQGGTITKVDLVDSNGSFTTGEGYNTAHVDVVGTGTGAKVRPIFGPPNGLGADPIVDLRATALMFQTSPDGDEGSTWTTNNDFRQVALVRNPTIADSSATTTLFTASSGNALQRLKFSSKSVEFTEDNTLLGAISGANAHVVRIDSDEVYFMQNEDTLFKPFVAGESISEINGEGVGVLRATANEAFVNPDVNISNGEIMYIDNRAAITRSADQSEDVKIIIQL